MKKILKFQADWCGPCHAIAPTVVEVGHDTGLEIESIDIDNQPEIAESYGVQSIPTLILVEDGAEIARHTGSAPKKVILAGLGLA